MAISSLLTAGQANSAITKSSSNIPFAFRMQDPIDYEVELIAHTKSNIDDPDLTEFYSALLNPEFFTMSGHIGSIVYSTGLCLLTNQLGDGSIGVGFPYDSEEAGMAGLEDGVSYQQTYAMHSFMFDGDKIQINIGIDDCRIKVDGKYTTAENIPSTDGKYVEFNFGSRKLRRIDVVFGRSKSCFRGIKTRTTDSVYPAIKQDTKVLFMGDSIGQGVVGGGDTVCGVSVSNLLLSSLGVEHFCNNSIALTGFCSDANGIRKNYVQRIPDIIKYSPDVIVVAASSNDSGFTDLEIEANVASWLSQTRTALPNVQIIVIGIPAYQNALSRQTLEQTVFDAVDAEVLANNYDNVFKVPILTETDVKMLSDAGKDVYATDGTHPTLDGYIYQNKILARKLQCDILTALQRL